MTTETWNEIDALKVNNKPYLRDYELDLSTFDIGKYYQVKVTVDNSVGTAESDTNVFLLAEVPSKPAIPTRASDGTLLTIIMSQTSFDGGAQVTNYEL